MVFHEDLTAVLSLRISHNTATIANTAMTAIGMMTLAMMKSAVLLEVLLEDAETMQGYRNQ